MMIDTKAISGSKAKPHDFAGRFREIISDPLNMLIRRTEDAGQVSDGLVTLHNGHRVPFEGEKSYYQRFSRILIFNRGVHEPYEEFAFQQMIPTLPAAPVMLELGAYWAHYSMWLIKERPAARTIMVEPDLAGLAAGQANFERHGYSGKFRQGVVGQGQLTVDGLMEEHGIAKLDILHCDIQGFEDEMLDGATGALSAGRVDRLFLSTHSAKLHQRTLQHLAELGLRIDAQSEFTHHTTSHDGFILALRPEIRRFMPEIAIMGRLEIAKATPSELVRYVSALSAAQI